MWIELKELQYFVLCPLPCTLYFFTLGTSNFSSL
jgi:hypothetical protein